MVISIDRWPALLRIHSVLISSTIGTSIEAPVAIRQIPTSSEPAGSRRRTDESRGGGIGFGSLSALKSKREREREIERFEGVLGFHKNKRADDEDVSGEVGDGR